MVVSYEEAMQAIKNGKISPVYLIYGEEGLQQDKIVQALKVAWLSDVLPEFNYNREDGTKLSGAQIADFANQLPFMAARRMLLVDNPSCIPCTSKSTKGLTDENQVEEVDHKREKSTEKTLLAYLERPADTTCLIFWYRQGKPDRRNKLVSMIEKLGGLVETPSLKPAAALQELRHMAAVCGKSFGPGALEHLARFSQPDLRILANELEKIITYSGETQCIDLRMVQAIMTPSLEADIFNLVDSLGQKQGIQVIEQLRGLLTRGEPGLRILHMMVRQFRLIFRAKIYLQKGYQKTQVVEAFGLHPFVVEKAMRQSKNFSFIELEQVMQQLLNKDLALKSGMDSRQALEELVLAIVSA